MVQLENSSEASIGKKFSCEISVKTFIQIFNELGGRGNIGAFHPAAPGSSLNTPLNSEEHRSFLEKWMELNRTYEKMFVISMLR